MRLKAVLSSVLLALAIVGAAAPDAAATHFRYGTLNWAPTATPGEVRFDFRVAFRRSGFSGTAPDGRPQTGDIITDTIGGTRLNFDDGTTTPNPLRFIVTDYSIIENWIIGLALQPNTSDPGIVHAYPGPGPYTARLINSTGGAACCRLSTLHNRPDGTYPLQTIVRPNDGNRSPVSNMVPVVVVPVSTAATFTVPASDPDGDPITWRLADSTEAPGSHPPNLSVDANTGVVTWNTAGPPPLAQTSFWTVQIVIEDRDAGGAVKTKTPVDFLLKITPLQGNAPSCAVDPPGPFNVGPGQPVSFVLTGTDVDAGDQVTLAGSGVPLGATMVPSLPVTGFSPVTSAFSWTPTSADGGSHVINFSATDIFGNQGLCSATINVVPDNTAPTITCAADATLECAGPNGTPHTLTAHVEDADGDALTVTWRVNGTLVETDTVPAPASGPTSADVSMSHNYAMGTNTVEVTIDDGQAANRVMRQRRLEAGVDNASATCTTTVTVVDTVPSVVTCAVTETMLWPPNHNMVNVGLTATSSDSCTGGSGPAGVVVYGDEDDEDPTGDGRFSPDALDIASGTLRLRSEREGDKNGRVYLILATAGGGHACCTVTVPKDMSARGRASVIAQATAAEAVCEATGAPPADYVVVGDSPTQGPKQINDTPLRQGSPVPRARATRGDASSGGKRQRRQ